LKRIFFIILIFVTNYTFSNNLILSTNYNNIIDYNSPKYESSLKESNNKVEYNGEIDDLVYNIYLGINYAYYILNFINFDQDQLISNGNINLNYSGIKYNSGIKLSLGESYIDLSYDDRLNMDSQILFNPSKYISFGFQIINTPILNYQFTLQDLWIIPIKPILNSFSPIIKLSLYNFYLNGKLNILNFDFNSGTKTNTVIYEITHKSDYNFFIETGYKSNLVNFNIGYEYMLFSLGNESGVSLGKINNKSFMYFDSENFKYDNVSFELEFSKFLKFNVGYQRWFLDEGEGIISSVPLSGIVIWEKMFVNYNTIEMNFLSIGVLGEYKDITYGIEYNNLHVNPFNYQAFNRLSFPGILGLPSVSDSSITNTLYEFEYDFLKLNICYNLEINKDTILRCYISQLIPIEDISSSSFQTTTGNSNQTSIYGGLSINLSLEISI